jgi:hypothetical protein
MAQSPAGSVVSPTITGVEKWTVIRSTKDWARTVPHTAIAAAQIIVNTLIFVSPYRLLRLGLPQLSHGDTTGGTLQLPAPPEP